MGTSTRPGLIAAGLNAIALGFYIWREAAIAGSASKWPVFCIAMTAILAPSAIGAAVGRRAIAIVGNLQLSLAACIVTLALLEAAFRLFPAAFPDNLHALVESSVSSQDARKAVVELLPHSPFAKPRANVDVYIPGYYGPKDSFVYQWRSDRRGFKNTPAIAALDEVKAVAIGDSFTEGMGVATVDTWTTRLSAKGQTTYNLGIQGYAPTQFLGAWQNYGRQLKPEWVIVGILGNVYTRQQAFLGSERETADDRAVGTTQQAIGRLVERDRVNQHRPVYFETREGYRVPVTVTARCTFLVSAVAVLTWQQISFARHFDIKSGIPNAEDDERFVGEPASPKVTEARSSLMRRYRREIALAPAALDGDALMRDPSWQSMERTIEDVIRTARKDGARVLLVFFPNRGSAYYEKSTGLPLPDDAFDPVQARALKAFAAKNDVAWLDFLPIFKNSVDRLTDSDPITAYPYLKIDGHPSPVGHEIIATELARVLASGR